MQSVGVSSLRRAFEKEDHGRIMAGAKIRFDKKAGQYQIESFGDRCIKAANVRPSK
jgi:hypothetical protein